jgi:endoplasmic reticulum-Golgi intermediate compartment protein 2
MLIAGIFFRYDVEPMQLTILHGHLSTYQFLMRLVALIGGVVICTEWVYKGYDALVQKIESKGRRVSAADGLLNGVIEKET